MKRAVIYGLLLMSVTSLVGCDRRPAQPQEATTAPAQQAAAQSAGVSPVPVATIREIMDSEVDPSADAIWDSVGTVISKKGVKDLQPRTDEEWHELRRRAVTLVEASNLIAMNGREAAKQSADTDKEARFGVLKPEEAQARIQADRANFVSYAAGLQQLSLQIEKMIDNRDVQGLKNIGGDLDNACENCHLIYWYPPKEKK